MTRNGRPPQLFRQRDRPLGGDAYLLDVGPHCLWIACLLSDELAVIHDHREQVAEVVDEHPVSFIRVFTAGAHSRFTSRQVFTSPSRLYPSSSSTLRAIARPRPASLVGAGMARVI